MRLQASMAEQLNTWAAERLEVTNEAITTSEFYAAMQRETELYATDSNLIPRASILLAQIVATSPTLIILTMWNNNIGEHAEAFGNAIAGSAITTLRMSDNNIGEYASGFVN